MRDYASLLPRVRNVLRPFSQRMFFLHVPKCGGTAVYGAIRSLYLGLDFREKTTVALLDRDASCQAAAIGDGRDTFEAPAAFDRLLRHRGDLLLYALSQESCRFVCGHYAFSDAAQRAFADRYAFVTLLRHPVERWISSYFQHARANDPWFDTERDIDAFLESDFGQAQGYEQVRFIGGVDDGQDYTSSAAIHRAQANLEKFAIVGTLERLHRFQAAFHTRFGRPLRLRHLNQRPPTQSAAALISKARRERIAEICQPDLELYHHACRLDGS